MTDEVDNISEKLKDYLTRKLTESKVKIKKLKRKRNITKAVIYTSTIASIVISSITASVSLLLIPVFVVTTLSKRLFHY